MQLRWPAPLPPRTLPRGIALFLGGFTLLNLAGERFIRGFDATIWWLDLHMLPSPLPQFFLLLFALLMLLFGLRLRAGQSRPMRILLRATALAAAAAATANAVSFFVLAGQGSIAPGTPLPFSLFVALGLLCIAAASFHDPRAAADRSVRRTATLLSATGIALLFPLLLVLFFGSTDYRRPADVAVVFGARAFADGSPSAPLLDRVERACELYRAGLVRRILFSGGPGDGSVHETEAMKAIALRRGVAPEDILLDRDGVDTEHTAANSTRMIGEAGGGRIIAVSHSYHLPRIKMTFMRYGRNVYTIPADDTSRHGRNPGQLAREIVAFWAYYLRPFSRIF